MKIFSKSILFLSIFCTLFMGFTLPVSASTSLAVNHSDRVIFGDYTLASGDTNQGDLVVIGGNVVIEEGATVMGTLAVIGGGLTINGTVNGDIVSVGGSGEIGDSAYISGSMVSIGSNLSISDDATILGETVLELDNNSVQIAPIPDIPNPVTPPVVPEVTFNTSPGLEFLRQLFSTSFMVLAIAALGLLIGILFPSHLKKTAKSIVNEPVKSGVLGFLTVFVAPIVFVILAITIILLPVSLLAILALGILMLYGWVAVGYEIGLRVSSAAKVNWEPSIIAGLGTLILSSIAALVAMIPCIGFLIYPIVTSVGLGGVLISQFGRREVASVQTAPVQEILAVNPVESIEPISADEKTE
jgi:hypothetical protein